MRVVITGGGTGGHLYPGLAIAEALQRLAPHTEILFIGGRKLDARVVPEQGWPFRAIAGAGLPRRSLPGAARALVTTAAGIVQALHLLRQWRPDVVVATGGYVCAPVGAAAVVLGVPLVLQEQNLRAGLANRVLARWARWVSVPHPDTTGLRARRLEVTGVPIRARALEGDRSRGIQRWGLEPDRVTLLVLGGSQGAHSVNKAVCQAADVLMGETPLQILHQTGTEDLAWVREAIGRREHVGPPAVLHVPAAFLDPVGDAYACADLVCCRAGAATLAEITAWGLPAIVIPYPHAGGHQDENAAVLVRAGAAVRVADADLAGGALVTAIQTLWADQGRRTAMSHASRALGRPRAAAAVAGLILAMGGERVAQEARAS
ncbi:MAG: undecaprenyldiphospho-muramoylpentapeptide beta-N-acetylglucosaminyltransferase [Armatimonadota bacterium]|nr:undecaprenyldiphospho-muramoylpentapeptide beta-N-acetylglucosaminyltransferase [Armatimonadota bacterium]